VESRYRTEESTSRGAQGGEHNEGNHNGGGETLIYNGGAMLRSRCVVGMDAKATSVDRRNQGSERRM
jgi:hypothetical protein